MLQARRYLEETGLIVIILAADRERRDKLEKTRQQWWNELPPQPESMKAGLCVVGGYSPDLWNSGRYDHAQRAEAISICRRCPALADCAEWSLSLPATEKYAI